MVEPKLFRVPCVENLEPAYLFQISVQIDLSANPKVRDMFTDSQANDEMSAFLQAHRIRIENKYEKDGKVTRIELRGSPEGLAKFRETYLTDSQHGKVWCVWARRKSKTSSTA